MKTRLEISGEALAGIGLFLVVTQIIFYVALFQFLKG